MFYGKYALPICLALTCSLALGKELTFSTLKVGTVVYSNVIITSANASDVYFQHSGGVSNAKIRQLEPEVQKQLHYNPKVAAREETDLLVDNEEYRRIAAMSFQMQAAKNAAKIAAIHAATSGPPFSIADPIDNNSPVNKPAPGLKNVTWITEKPVDSENKFTIIYFWNPNSKASLDFVPTVKPWTSGFTNLTIVAISSASEKELEDSKKTIPFSSGSESTGKLANELGISSIPAVALIDPFGIVRFTGHPAALSTSALGKIINRYQYRQE